MDINQSKALGGSYERIKELERRPAMNQGNTPVTRQEVMDMVYEMLRVYNGDATFIRPVILTNKTADPDNKVTGALAVVSGKLKVFDGTNWVVVGTQT